MKKVFMALVAVLVVSVSAVGCGEMVDTATGDSSERGRGVDEEYQVTTAEQNQDSFVTQENMWQSEADYITGPTGTGYKAEEFQYKTTISPSLGVSFEEFVSDLTETGYEGAESSSTETEFPSSLEEIVLGPTGTGYKVVESPETEIEFPSSLEDLILGPTGTGYKSTD